jgi:ATP/maltotriose-dependent transcriptional regulator MalT
MGEIDLPSRLVWIGEGDTTLCLVALDRGDNDPVTFWTYVIEALRTQQPATGADSLPMLRVPRI